MGVTSPGVYVLALDANDGRLRWRQSLWWAAPCGTLAVGDERIYVPTEPGTGVFQLDRADGKQRRGGIGTQVAYIRGREGDAEELRQGFAVHGGGEVLGLNRQEVRASGWAYDLLPAAGDTEPRLTRMQPPLTAFGDERLVFLLIGESSVYFVKRGEVVAVNRADLWKMTLVRERKGDERDGFLRWWAKDLPCGAPSWPVLAAGAKAGAGSTLLAGGPKASPPSIPPTAASGGAYR